MSKKSTTYLIFFISVCFFNQTFAQGADCSCKTDLTFLHDKIKKTPSYKINKTAYNDLYSESIKKAENLNSGYDCYVLLNKLLIGLKDNHCKIYGIDKGAIQAIREDSIKYKAFKKSPIFNQYPKSSLNLDSLKTVLSAKSTTDIEGIYTKINYLTIGVFKSGTDYKAIVLDSEKDLWKAGEIIYTLVPYGNNYLLGIGGDIASKRLIAYTERIENGFFLTMGFQKEASKTNFSVSMYSDSTYIRKELSAEISYLKIGSFNSWYPTLSDAEAFYKSLEGTLTKKNLIIDLRDNGGGGDRNSAILFKIIKDYQKENKVYIITNNRTASNAEQFTFKLSLLENCKTFGDRTSGTIAYEIVGSNYHLPCSNFVTILTSKKHSKYLEIESEGIEPQVKFSMESDWINQLLSYMKENN